MNIEIANRLIQLRKQNGLSQEELAAKLGLSRQAVSKWERAEASPDTDNLICLAKLYGISLDDLLNTEQPVEEIARDVKEQSVVVEAVDTKVEDAKVEDCKMEGDPSKKEGLSYPWFPFDPYGFHSVSPNGKTLEFFDEKGNPIPIAKINELEQSLANGTKVSIERDEIKVSLPDGAYIHIEVDEVEVLDPYGTKTSYDVSSDVVVKRTYTKDSIFAIVAVPATALLCLAGYFLLGFLLPDGRGWSRWWVLFFLIPFVAQILGMVKSKSIAAFPVVFTVLLVYIPLGFYLGLWHPAWVLFLLIPLFYIIVGPIDAALSEKRKAKREGR